MEEITREKYEFEGIGRCYSICKLRIIGNLFILEEREDNPGTSITNSMEILIQKISEEFDLYMEDMVVIEKYMTNVDTYSIKTYDKVIFGINSKEKPEIFRWERIKSSEVDNLIDEQRIIIEANYLHDKEKKNDIIYKYNKKASLHKIVDNIIKNNGINARLKDIVILSRKNREDLYDTIEDMKETQYICSGIEDDGFKSYYVFEYEYFIVKIKHFFTQEEQDKDVDMEVLEKVEEILGHELS